MSREPVPTYPLELRERAVRVYRTAEPKPVIRRMAEELGVHHEALRNWIRQAEADAGERGDIPPLPSVRSLPPFGRR
ncbi:transposase, partial [Streptomyces lavendulae]|uniref:transposase n=1 Tax=Streptomyces lavendulae TaxID=1914 RepID=UPI003410482C